MAEACYLYELRFPSGKSYIGISSAPARRWALHRHHANRGTRTAVCAALRKYGWASVCARVMAAGPRDYIANLEIAAIAAFKTRAPAGYNIALGGDEAPSRSPEAREKIRSSKKAHWQDPAYRARMVASSTGRRMTPEQNERNRQAKLRHWRDPIYRQKCSDAHKGQAHAPETIERRREALCAAWAAGKGAEARKLAMTGRIWVNNGSEHRQLIAGENVPDGWTRGMLKRAVR